MISISALTTFADLVYPSQGQLGHVILLRPDLTVNLALTANPLLDELTSVTPHKLVTGSRFRINTGGLPPDGLSANIDYFAIVVAPLVIRPAATLAAALAGLAVNFTNSGSGSLTLNEQLLTVIDSPSVLIAKEIEGGFGYLRMSLANLGAASFVANGAQKPLKSVSFTNTSMIAIQNKHVLIAYGASSLIGNSVGITSYFLQTEPTVQVTPSGQTRTINITFKLQAG